MVNIPDCISTRKHKLIDDEVLLDWNHLIKNFPNPCTKDDHLPCMEGHPRCFHVNQLCRFLSLRYERDQFKFLIVCVFASFIMLIQSFISFAIQWRKAFLTERRSRYES